MSGDVTFHFGPKIGEFGNGKPKYALEWWTRWSWYKTQTLHALPLYPVINFTPWHSCVLATDLANGISTHSISIGLEFWTWNAWITIGRTRRKI